jgi:hypothetical protein
VGHVDELFQQVYRHPDDDHVRQVLSDALISIGDPRGDLIQLQLHPASDHDRRAMRLIQQHGLRWLGPLRGAVVPLAYERGFLASCLIVDDPAAVIDRDEWATVHTIELPPDPVGMILHPVMRSLRRLVHVTPNTLLNLASRHQPQLERMVVEAVYSPMFDQVLGRYLATNAVGALTIRNVPFEQADLLRRFASRHTRMKLDLLTLPPAAVHDDDEDAERFDEVDE